MSADALLSRLENVRQTSPDRWVACCPAHASKSKASLAVRDLDDGRVLVHCFGGCDVQAVVQAAGLEMDALFPPRPLSAHSYKPERRPFPAADVLRAVASEITVVRVIGASMQRGRLSAGSDERLGLAMVRLMKADEMVNECR